MLKAIQPADQPIAEEVFCPSRQNFAVALCYDAWERVFTATRKQNSRMDDVRRCAAAAYKVSMPPLAGFQNICDFIACVGYGVLLTAIKPEDAGKLLYAAQVALCAIPAKDRKPAT
jgi:hypothetical protein